MFNSFYSLICDSSFKGGNVFSLQLVDCNETLRFAEFVMFSNLVSNSLTDYRGILGNNLLLVWMKGFYYMKETNETNLWLNVFVCFVLIISNLTILNNFIAISDKLTHIFLKLIIIISLVFFEQKIKLKIGQQCLNPKWMLQNQKINIISNYSIRN